MDTAVIKSGNTSATLTFCERDADYFTVLFESPAVKLKKRVWGYTDCEFLVNLFSFIAKEWKGWQGAQEWASIEGEFAISATSDALGRVTLNIKISEFDGPEIWSSNVTLGLDASQTENIAKSVGAFFAN
ncbi:DUF6228 family protein [Shewanella mangrovisoli]|uniref:DUF6228 family protein n=1 Tax=Shewanella mangrovisoli TaxID=2864211 RepID=UPI0035BA0386